MATYTIKQLRPVRKPASRVEGEVLLAIATMVRHEAKLILSSSEEKL
jgi:hypothetical protein